MFSSSSSRRKDASSSKNTNKNMFHRIRIATTTTNNSLMGRIAYNNNDDNDKKKKSNTRNTNTFLVLLFIIGAMMVIVPRTNNSIANTRNNNPKPQQQQQQREQQQQVSSSSTLPKVEQPISFQQIIQQQQEDDDDDEDCIFRKYPPHRYYGLYETDKQKVPTFLTDTEYIYGEHPILLFNNNNDRPATIHKKLCVNQSGWIDSTRKEELPFADGTNPSIISISRLLQQEEKANQQDTTITISNTYHFLTSLLNDYPTSYYISTLCMTNSQCNWNDTPDQIQQYKLSTLKEPLTVRTVIIIFDIHFHKLLETTIYLQQDAPRWGRKHLQMHKDNDKNNGYELQHYALDDARLFTTTSFLSSTTNTKDSNSQEEGLPLLWISYREGENFGYDKQVLNPVYLTYNKNNNDENKISAIIKASQSIPFCCGRNMALMESRTSPYRLQSLTWVDPVTVIDVDISSILPQTQQQQQQRQRQGRLGKRNGKAKSHIHGTNAFMVYLKKYNEYLGIGHFHRPYERENKANEYARHGHHYTHCFFTISAAATDSKDSFHLKRLSQEFVLPSSISLSSSSITNNDDNTKYDQDGEIIQFISGLEVISLPSENSDDVDNDLVVLAYGINDCEGAAMYVPMETINSLLRPVEQDPEQPKEVLDFMKSYTIP